MEDETKKLLCAEFSKMANSCTKIALLLGGDEKSSIDNSSIGEVGYDIMYNEYDTFIKTFKKENNQNAKKGIEQKPSNNHQNILIEKEEIELQKGSISKRTEKNGSIRYMGRYYDIDGKQKSVYAKTKGECALKLKEALKELDKRKKDDNTWSKNMTLNMWYDNWIDKYKKPILKESSLHIIKKNYDANIRNTLGKKTLQQINDKVAYDFIMGLPNYNRKKVSHMYLKDMFEKALSRGLIKLNPIDFIVAKEETNDNDDEGDSKIKYLTPEQIESIFSNMKEKDRIACELILYTGLRIGELLGLQWKDIDFDNNTINVNKQYNSQTKKYTTKLKTKTSKRIIPLFDNAKQILSKIKKGNLQDYIFGEDYYSIGSRLKSVAENVNIPFSLHSFRHTFASRCYEIGIDTKTIQAWLGHANYQITLDTYTHISDKQNNKEIDKFNKLSKQFA